MTARQYDVLFEQLVRLTKLTEELSNKIEELKIADEELSHKLDARVDIEGKLQALAVEISNLKDEKEI